MFLEKFWRFGNKNEKQILPDMKMLLFPPMRLVTRIEFIAVSAFHKSMQYNSAATAKDSVTGNFIGAAGNGGNLCRMRTVTIHKGNW